MPRKIAENLVGKRFGSRVVLEPVLINGRTRWKVLCDCGKESIVHRNNVIKSKGCKSCTRIQTHCPRGHELTEDNLYKSGDNRCCRQCVLDRSNARYNSLSDEEKQQWMLAARIAHSGRDPIEFEQQKHLGLCALCGKRDKNRSLCSDHDHSCCAGTKSCGKCTRDFLCQKCNQGIGFLLDSPELLRAAAIYVESWRRKHDSRRFDELVRGASVP
jgi:Recombination endonuclease VII